jgi:hypothetical protein
MLQVPGALAGTKSYPIADRGSLALEVPDGWRDEVRRNYYRGRPFTIVLTPPAGEGFVVHVSPTWPSDARAHRPGPADVHEGVRTSADALRSQAAEAELKVINFRAGEVFGSYYAATAKAAKPGEYKHVMQGTFVVADLTVNFAIYTNEDDDPAVEKAFAAMRTARREAR